MLHWLPVLALLLAAGAASSGAAGAADAPEGPDPADARLLARLVGPAALVLHPAVLDDLKATAAQRRALRGLARSVAAELAPLAEPGADPPPERERKQIEAAGARLVEVSTALLDDEQRRRLAQVGLQQEGLLAVARPEIRAALRVTRGQNRELEGVFRRAGERLAAAGKLSGGARPAPEELLRLRRRHEEEIRAVLSAEQLERWSSLLGPPLRLETGPGPEAR